MFAGKAGLEAGWQGVRTAQLLSGVSSRDIAFQVLDCLFLSGDDPIHQIADRYHAHNHLTLHHGEMANATVRHDGHALGYRLSRSYEDHGAGHDFPNLSLLGGTSLEDDLA